MKAGFMIKSSFRAKWWGWTWRGALCAAASFLAAWRHGFTDIDEICGMLTAVVAWAGTLAWFDVWLVQAAPSAGPRFTRALRLAAWIKCLATPVGLVAAKGLAGCGASRFGEMLELGALVDALGGHASLWIVGEITALLHLGSSVAALTSYRWTALVALVDGGFIIAQIAVLALFLFTSPWPASKERRAQALRERTATGGM